MRILVTGACGMLGRLVAAELRGKHDVVATDVLPDCEQMDIADVDQVFGVVTRQKPDLVIHCAAMTDVDGCERDPDRAFKLNGVGTWNLACACASVGAEIIYVSTDYVFDGEKGEAYTEFDSPNPMSAYGGSKLAGEKAVMELCPRHYIVRTSWVFAPHGKNFALTILNAAEKKIANNDHEPLRVVEDQVGSPTYAKDLAGFLCSLVGSPLYGLYHFTNGGACSWYEFASKIIETAGRTQVRVLPIKTEDWPTPTRRPKYSVLRHYRMELLGRDTARPWEDAVAEFVSEWTTAKQ